MAGQLSAGDTIVGESFDHYVQKTAHESGVRELMGGGGQALLRDLTMHEELDELQWLANEQLEIACRFDKKFSQMVFTLLKKMQQAFLTTGEIAQNFVNDMATAGLNFIKDAMAYKAEPCSSDSMMFAEGLKKSRLHIADLIRKAGDPEVMYEGAQKKFSSILERMGEEV